MRKPNQPKKPPLEDVIYDMVDRCGRSHADIAKELGKSRSTLTREISPYDDGAKFGALDIIPLSNSCNSDAIIEWLADERGYRLVPKKADPDGADLNEEIAQAYEASGSFLAAARRAGVKLVDLLPLRRRVAKEMDDVVARKIQEGDEQ